MGKAKDRRIWASIALLLTIASIPSMAMSLVMLPLGALGHAEMSHIWVAQEEDYIVFFKTAPIIISKETRTDFHQILKGVCWSQNSIFWVDMA